MNNQHAQGILILCTAFVCDSSNGGNFGVGNCCWRVISGLFTTVISCFWRTRVRVSVTPLMYGREANDLCDSDASTILKNVPTSSVGDNTVVGRILLGPVYMKDSCLG